MCPTLPNIILQNLSIKIPSKKNVPWHRRYNALQRGSNCHFCQKNAFFRQKLTFFQKDRFIEKWSVTQNTIFKCIKNNFLLSNPELVFFTEFNLTMPIPLEIGTLMSRLNLVKNTNFELDNKKLFLMH